ncbi:MAG: hypothetical protein AAFY59_01575 [Pseudomonadota bacterium]
MRHRWALPLLVAIAALVLVLAFVSLVRLPHLFWGSDALLAGLLAGSTALAISLMLPDAWLYNRSERIRHAFLTRHDISEDRAAVALQTIQKAAAQSDALATGDNGFAPELAERVRRTAEDLAEIAQLLFEQPDQIRRKQALVARADLVVEAVEKHAALRASKGVSEAQIGEAREMVLMVLDQYSDALAAQENSRIESHIEGIETTAEVADGLLDRMTLGKGRSS